MFLFLERPGKAEAEVVVEIRGVVFIGLKIKSIPY